MTVFLSFKTETSFRCDLEASVATALLETKLMVLSVGPMAVTYKLSPLSMQEIHIFHIQLVCSMCPHVTLPHIHVGLLKGGGRCFNPKHQGKPRYRTK